MRKIANEERTVKNERKNYRGKRPEGNIWRGHVTARANRGCFPLMREINRVVFAAPSSLQESGIESVATLAADFRSSRTRSPHLLRVRLARFPGETAIEHTRRSPFDGGQSPSPAIPFSVSQPSLSPLPSPPCSPPRRISSSTNLFICSVSFFVYERSHTV